MRKNLFFHSTFLLLLTCCLFLASTSHGASIKDRMAERIPAINQLKDQGLIGENNKGFLELRQGDQGADLVSAENQDRQQVYQAIAKKQGASPELVGQRRAIMIDEIGKPGHWHQRPDGSWYQK